jgi:RNA polymerase sigma-70 factor, ECF subfamily
MNAGCRLMTGDEERFQEIYDEFHERIYRYLARMAGDHEAEDLTQDVFVKVGIALEKFRGDSQLSTWIYRIATNTAIDRLRRMSKEANGFHTEPIQETDESESIPLPIMEAGEQHVIRKEMNSCIRGIIEILPEAYRSVIVLSELEGFQDNEIAEILGITLRAAKIRLHRARTRLREKLQKSCVFFRDEQGEFSCDRK